MATHARAIHKLPRRKYSKVKPGILSTNNLKLIHKTAAKVSNNALRNALLRLIEHQEQLRLFS